jgi:hypothetical protein
MERVTSDGHLFFPRTEEEERTVEQCQANTRLLDFAHLQVSRAGRGVESV